MGSSYCIKARKKINTNCKKRKKEKKEEDKEGGRKGRREEGRKERELFLFADDMIVHI